MATAVGVFLVYLQLREAARARRSETTAALLEGLGSEEQRSLRRFIYQSDFSEPISDEARLKIERVAVYLSRTAVLCTKGLADRETVLDIFAEAFVRTWDRIRPFVESERLKRGPTYLQALEMMTAAAHTHWKAAPTLPPAAPGTGGEQEAENEGGNDS